MPYGLTEMVSRALEVTEKEADEIINEQASIGLDKMAEGDLNINDVEDLMLEMGVEPDLMDEFLLRMI